MQTGYDNYWMYQSSRHEPVHNLQKNDSYMYPVLPDNYKQMQNGGCPSNRMVSHVNNVTSSQNGQYSAGPHCMWPSSVYSLPFSSSYPNNYHPQGFPAQPSNCNYSSHQPQPKQSLRNSGANVMSKSKSNNPKQCNRVPQICNYNETENSRIRVKNVFSLNNNSMYNAPIDNSAAAAAQKNKQYEYPLNYAGNNCNRTCDFEANIPTSNHIISSQAQREQQYLASQQQFLQYSNAVYHQNAQISSEGHAQSNSSNQRDGTLPPKGFSAKPSFLMELLRNRKNQEETQENNLNTIDGSERVITKPKRNQLSLKPVDPRITTERATVAYHDSSQVSERLNYDNLHGERYGFVPNQNQNQADFPEPDQSASLRRFPSIEDPRRQQLNEQIVTSKASGFSNTRISTLENNTVKITIPHTGQSTYINPVEPNSRDRNPNLSLPCLLESHPEIYHDITNKNNTQNYVQQNVSNRPSVPENNQIRQKNCNASPVRNHAYNTSPRSIPNESNSTLRNPHRPCQNITSPRNQVSSAQRFQQESFENSKRQESEKTLQNSENPPENFNTNSIDESENNNEFNENSPEETVINIMTVKQEKYAPRVFVRDPQLDQDLTIDEIKTEEYSENFEMEPEFSESNSPEEEIFSSNSNDSVTVVEDIVEEPVVSKKIGSKSLKAPKESTTVRNRSKESEKSKKEKAEKNIAVQKAKSENREKKSYKCKINRDKLDLLIEFIKKDDEVIELKTPEDSAVRKITDEGKNNNEVNLSRSRRKLCKTNIVKNKNNTREMVSMMSLKTSRAENPDTVKRSQTVKIDGSSNSEEKRDSRSLTEGKVVEKCIVDLDKENPESPEGENYVKSINEKTQEIPVDDEKNIRNIMKALQNLESHFCLSCTLVSPIESFWINVVSSELRCLNCFKKMSLKNDENNLKMKKIPSGDSNKTETKYSPNDKENDDKKGEHAHEKLTEHKLMIKQENSLPFNQSAKNNTSYRTSEELSIASKNKDAMRKKSVDRKEIATTEEKLEMKTKRKNSVREDSVSDKQQNTEERASTVKSGRKSISEEIEVLNYSKDSLGKKNEGKEEIGSPKTKAFDKKDRKPPSPGFHSSIEQKSPKESCEQEMYKDEEISGIAKKEKKHKESNHCRKRSNSKEESGFHKVRISEEEVASVKSPSNDSFESYKLQTAEIVLKRHVFESFDKSKASTDHKKHIKTKHSSSLDDSERRNKNADKGKSFDGEELTRKRRISMDETIPHKIRGVEDRSKLDRISEKSKVFAKVDDRSFRKMSEHSGDSPRSKSKDEGKEPSEGENTELTDKTRRGSTYKENLNSPEHSKKETNHEGSISKSREKKSSLSKTSKISRKSSEENNFDLIKSSVNEEKKSKPLKESQQIDGGKKSPSPVQLLRESKHKNKEQSEGKITEKKNHVENGSKSEKKKKLFEEAISQRCDKSQTVRHSKKERALECIFGRKKDDVHLNDLRKMSGDNPPSTKLMEKLIEKTKKLSWSLLEES